MPCDEAEHFFWSRKARRKRRSLNNAMPFSEQPIVRFKFISCFCIFFVFFVSRLRCKVSLCFPINVNQCKCFDENFMFCFDFIPHSPPPALPLSVVYTPMRVHNMKERLSRSITKPTSAYFFIRNVGIFRFAVRMICDDMYEMCTMPMCIPYIFRRKDTSRSQKCVIVDYARVSTPTYVSTNEESERGEYNEELEE